MLEGEFAVTSDLADLLVVCMPDEPQPECLDSARTAFAFHSFC